MGEMVLWSVIALNFVFLRDAMPGVEGPRLELGGSRGSDKSPPCLVSDQLLLI
jgi:hypothetical protein